MATSPSLHQFLLEKGFPTSHPTLTLLQIDSLWHKVALAWLRRQPRVGTQSQKERMDKLAREMMWYQGLAQEFVDQMKIRMDQMSKISLEPSTPEQRQKMFTTMTQYFYPDPELDLCWRAGPIDDPHLTQESIIQLWKDFCHSDEGKEALKGLSWGSSPQTLSREFYRPGVESIPEIPPKTRAQWYDYWSRVIKGEHQILKASTQTSVMVEIIGYDFFLRLVKKSDSELSLGLFSSPGVTTEKLQKTFPQLDLTPGKIYCQPRYLPLFKGDWTSLPTAKLKVPTTSLQWLIQDHPCPDDTPEVPTKK